jgi:hypothetical protein
MRTYEWHVGLSINHTTQFITFNSDTAAHAAAFAPMRMYEKRYIEGLPLVEPEDMTVVSVQRTDLFA